MKRDVQLNKAIIPQEWDLIVIGGGASGLGVALESATRKYKTLLLEGADFAKGTSSRSTKLVHGGVRYLGQGDISLVLEALRERGLLRQNAPHLVKNQSFIIPNYEWWDGPFYTIGLKVYDLMAGKLGLGPSIHLSKQETLEALPTIRKDGLTGGVIYHDGQFDDARLSVNLAQTIIDYDGVAVNYLKVTGLIKGDNGLIKGVKAKDQLSGNEYEFKAKAVINATGVFTDEILQMDEPGSAKKVVPSQGIHLVLDHDFLQGDHAIMIPKTDDGRVLFAVPWRGKVVVGTTDTLIEEASLEPRALEEEIKFVLNTAGRYLTRPPKRSDVRSIFAGLRPLAAPEDDSKKTKEISRSHKVIMSLSGLITITGGKWTTYRKMGQDTVDKAAILAGLKERPCITENLSIHGYTKNVDLDDHFYVYGSEAKAIKTMIEKNPELGEKLHERLDFTKAEVVWACREEMAVTLDDVLARRVRALYLDARAAEEMAPEVARIMAVELEKNEAWIEQQLLEFGQLVKGYYL
ncbi:glycerol-3-phosphate dehydrogenase/oxidase [Prolixibacteraceae bacterium Z1-6]|uniref:Glycerol-3-phosphate dehydrogenase/oxidase n=1 Tax=Draconibacterium aestuarii TaxID=2998507 RepID=A0A9X3J3A6_9BACT|nr:glycerol-3-phosphate dehydrogenase/oxidase [Prolixibacteraceae bacterium Z1-6]